jgi:hypothetical protein
MSSVRPFRAPAGGAPYIYTRAREANKMNAACLRIAETLRRLGDVRSAKGGRGFAFAGESGPAAKASGITKLLQRVYYPDYKYRGGARGERGKGPKGMRRGTLVDVQVRDAVDALAAGVPFKKTKKTHPLTVKFMSALDVLGLDPVATQTKVGDRGERLATAVDLVARDRKTDRVVLIELKCGFNNYMDTSTGRMKHELKAYPNSPRFQHQLQLAVTTELFVRTFGIRPKTAYVLTANDHGVAYHELEESFRRAAPAVMARVADRM